MTETIKSSDPDFIKLPILAVKVANVATVVGKMATSLKNFYNLRALQLFMNDPVNKDYVAPILSFPVDILGLVPNASGMIDLTAVDKQARAFKVLEASTKMGPYIQLAISG